MTRRVARITHDERGAIMVMFAVALPIMLVFVAFVIDVANWWEHKRHLQMQADAAALAGGQAISGPCDNALVRAEILKYAGIEGSEYNAQIGGTPPERVHMAVNSKTWPLQSSPVDSTVIEGEPCDESGVPSGMVDVKLTESDVPWFLGVASAFGIDGADYINARARVSFMKVDQRRGGLPVGVPDSNPKRAKVQFINEDTGAALGPATELTRVGTFNGFTKWEVPATSAIPVTVNTGLKNIGMRVIMSGSTTNFECGQLLVSCYDTSHGLLHLRGWSDQGPGPVAKSIGLQDTTCDDAYFVYIAEGECRTGMNADIDFGAADPAAQGIKVTAVAGGNNYTLNYNPGQYATLTTALAGDNDDLTYTADARGSNGNDVRITYVVAGVDTSLSVAVAGNDITVNLATDGGGAATSTAAQVRDAVNADAGASPLVTVANATGNDGTGVVAAMSLTDLAGGDDGRWTLPVASGITMKPATGAVPIELLWEQTAGTRNGETCTTKKNNPCQGTFGMVQRPFSGGDARSGQIRIAKIYESGLPLTEHSLKQCNPGDDVSLCTHNLTVELGLVSGFEEATSPDSPVVALRVIGGSQNQSLDCDPWVDTMRAELIEGCRPTYAVNEGTQCPNSVPTLWESPQPWNCVALKTGGREGQVTAGMNGRILDNVQPTQCNHPSRWYEYWDVGEDGNPVFTPDQSDPRITNLFMTPYGSFEGSGRTTVPIINFATFYVTGWTGQPGFPNPCQGNGIDEIIGDGDPAWIYGRFIKYVETLSGSTGSTPCDFADFGSCTAVLTE
jgi:hypothetical protein